MEVVDFEHKIVDIAISIGHSFNHLDSVINSLYFGVRDAEVKIVEDTVGVSSQLSGEAGQLSDS